MKSWIWILVLSGCASEPEVLDIGAGRYSYTAVTHARCSSREEAVVAAREFCTQRHEAAAIQTFEDKGGPDPFQACSTSVVFSCTR